MRATPWIALLVLAVLVGCGESEPGEPQPARTDTEAGNGIAPQASRSSGAPDVGDPYQERIDEAWRKAVEGENPAYACASLKGRASMGSDSDAASRALSACNVDIPVRYFQTYIERVEAGDRSCLDLVMEVTTKLPAMTISMEAFPEIAERGSGTHASDDALADAGAVLAARGSSEGIVKDRLRHRISEVCPDEAGVLLGRSPPEPTSRAALEEGGAAAAGARFDEIVASRKGEYRLDPQALLELGTEYANRGDWETAQVVMMMGHEAQLADPEALEAMAEVETVLAEAEARAEAAEAARGDEPEWRFDRGEPRDDLARFHGLYGDPGDAGPVARRLWVSGACGYLTIGATWGDVAPWVMRSVSERVFIASSTYAGVEPLEVEFRMASDGSAEALTHNGRFVIEKSLARMGELPEGWGGEPVEGCDHQPR
ncbi:MAG: hypothetical protein ACREK5_05325 [Gemmatimonadota bacterium]